MLWRRNGQGFGQGLTERPRGRVPDILWADKVNEIFAQLALTSNDGG